MSFAEQLRRQQAAVFQRLGEDAAWSGVAGTVRVRRVERDTDGRFTEASVLVRTNIIRVRRAEVPSPAPDDIVTLAAGGVFKVRGEPVLDRKGVWTCDVREVAG